MDGSAEIYGFKPFPGSSHTWALAETRAVQGPALRVLDVGAAGGHLSQAIRGAHPDARITAVEPCSGPPADWPAEDVWVSSLEEVQASGFDLVLALDVLEHVADPAAFLERIAARCRPGAVVLISVPNVAHWSVRAQLALGRFEYTERGILDRTHLRFFTRRSLKTLVTECGLQIEAQSQSIVPLELVLPERVHESAPWALARRIRRAGARAWPGLLGFQLLVRARA